MKVLPSVEWFVRTIALYLHSFHLCLFTLHKNFLLLINFFSREYFIYFTVSHMQKELTLNTKFLHGTINLNIMILFHIALDVKTSHSNTSLVTTKKAVGWTSDQNHIMLTFQHDRQSCLDLTTEVDETWG